MNEPKKISVISELLRFYEFCNNGLKNFEAPIPGRKYLVFVKEEDGDRALSLHRSLKDKPTPWELTIDDFKSIIHKFKSNTILNVNMRSNNHDRVFSFIIKLTSGQIAFTGGSLSFRRISDEAVFLKELQKIDELFEV